MIRRVILAAVVCVLCTPAAAMAHAMLERASPMVGSVVHAAPTALSLRFSEPVEPALCTISLLRGDGAGVALAPPSPAEHGTMLVATVHGAMGAGAYRVHWRAVSVDTHVTEGDFGFRVEP